MQPITHPTLKIYSGPGTVIDTADTAVKNTSMIPDMGDLTV